jgi:endonuclease YncB( thermonuclease family)
MARSALTRNGPRTYAELRRRVEAALLVGQRKIEEARVRTYWETGRLIDQHLLLHKERADYGAQVVPKLARDLGVSDTVLYRCLRFARAFPILAARPELSWAHYRALLQIPDQARRREIAAKAARHGWTSRELETRLRPVELIGQGDGHVSTDVSTPKPLTPKRGVVGIYRIVPSGDGLAVDLGFTSYLDLTGAQADGLSAGDLVRLAAGGKVTRADDATKADLYTYRAEVLRVVDGDTLWLKVYLRERHWLKEKLRLRGVDCPELDTPEGRAAGRFVETLVSRTTSLTITTTKPDKWDRYLSDVHLELESGETVFLNNLLLENGRAVRKDGYALSDWDKADEGAP